VAALRSLLQVAGRAPQAFAAQYRARTGWLQTFLAHTDGAGALVCHAPLVKLRQSDRGIC
jgi:hypothetical protein